MANALRRTLLVSLPNIFRGDGTELFGPPATPESGDVVLVLYINFTINHRDITGYIAMLMDLPAMQVLQDLLHDLVRRENEPDFVSHAAN
jgi:chemotaxis protein CheC